MDSGEDSVARAAKLLIALNNHPQTLQHDLNLYTHHPELETPFTAIFDVEEIDANSVTGPSIIIPDELRLLSFSNYS